MRMSDPAIYAYVSHTERGDTPGGELRAFELDAGTGRLREIQRIETEGKVMPLAISPDRRTLHVVSRSMPYRVSSFAIDGGTGQLFHLAETPLPESMAYVSIDRTGRYLFASSTAGSKSGANVPMLSVSAIGPDGFVQPAHQIIRVPPKAHSILPDPANRFVIALSCDGELILRFRFDAATGLLSSDGLAPVRVRPGDGPRHFVFHPNHRRVYLLTEPGAWIYVFDYDGATGTLEERQIVSAVPPDANKPGHGADIRISPDGRMLFASERATGSITGFAIDPVSGLLSYAGHAPTEAYPRSFAIDPFGRYLVAAGHKSHGLTVHSIGPTGGLLDVVGRYAVGRGPNWIEIVRLR